MCHIFFFNSLARSRYLSFFHFIFNFALWSVKMAKSTILQVLLFFLFLIIIRSGRLADNNRSVCMLKSHRSVCVTFSRTAAGLCMYHLIVWSNLNFLNNSKSYYHYDHYIPLRVFHSTWWFFSWVSQTALLPKSPDPFSLFWPMSVIMVSILSLTSKFSSPFTNPLGIF